jgi:membrane protease YdiL (CAAX protease family)
MPGVLDLLYVALFAVAWPLYGYYVDWPAFLRRLQEAPRQARLREYATTAGEQWLHAGRPWPALGLQAPAGWRLWAPAGLVTLLVAMQARQVRQLARQAPLRGRLRKQLVSIEALLPHTTGELSLFLALSLTAGLCEEFLFRGYVIWALAPWLGFWGAAALGVVVFGFAHVYQGRGAMVRTGLVGAVMTGVLVTTQSLFPAMALHTLIDAGSGILTWIALREEEAPGGTPEGPAQAYS